MSTQNPISKEAIETIVAEALQLISESVDLASLKAVRSTTVGDGSAIAKLSSSLGKLPADEKAEAGKLITSAKTEVNQAFQEKEQVFYVAEQAKKLEAEAVDVTAAPLTQNLGARHPLSLLQDNIADIFIGMGWEIAEGPEVESEWFNFDALNFDADHPARAMQDLSLIHI